MKLRFKHQQFQADAASAVCKVFTGQPNVSGLNNQKVLLTDEVIINNLQQVQKQNQIEPSPKLEGKYNLTLEMETGVGKTYTYIKTMHELNKRYGWSKFIVVVPSVAIREGVLKSFDLTKEHFAEEYHQKIRFFIYNSQNLTQLDQFANDNGINVMIINSQAFNAKGNDARRIHMKHDSFRSRRPIDVIAQTNPIVIIDEPQSVEGRATKDRLKEFNALMTLRYSATHKNDSVYNLIYRLDAFEAYKKQLVKKIAVKGISVTGSTATEGYLYLEKLNLSENKPPTAILEFEMGGKNGIRKSSRVVREGYDLYEHSGGLDEYRGFIIARINGLTNTVEFTNGVILTAGEVVGGVNEEQIRRIQIRETIKSHFERERQLFDQGVKVLSLFFIDEVANYRQYDASGRAINGEYARIFEDEYAAILTEWQSALAQDDYLGYLNRIRPEKTHAGYFSIDKKSKRFTNSKVKDPKQKTSDDADAYDLIMKDKERLLDRDEPVRFIFSHSALREGWDNPNVFQICTLKQSGSDVRKRQEVGRGLRLCVNQNGERMDNYLLGEDVHYVNVLTVIANESYDSFAKRLQEEIAEEVAGHPNNKAEDLLAITPEDARSNKRQYDFNSHTQHKVDNALWGKTYVMLTESVNFDRNEFINKSIQALNKQLNVSQISFRVEQGELNATSTKEDLMRGEAFTNVIKAHDRMKSTINQHVKYDLIGRIVEKTGLTRRAIGMILRCIEKETFEQFHRNPEEFIVKASNIINDQKSTMLI